MNEDENYLKSYKSVSKDIKFVSNSLIRLKILNTLKDNPKDMKSISEDTNISYSSISSALHVLELKGMVYRYHNKYCLTNVMKLHMDDISKIKVVANLLDEFYSITNGHIVDTIPEQSLLEFHLLENAELFQSSSMDAFKIYGILDNILIDAKRVRCILPVFYVTFNKQLNDLVDNNKFVEIKVAEDILAIYEEKSKVKFLSPFKKDNNFLLIITNEIMVLGLFKEDGKFDQNRLIISTSDDSLRWANNLFRYFKKLNK